MILLVILAIEGFRLFIAWEDHKALRNFLEESDQND